MKRRPVVTIDALFLLACDCILDGHSGSDPARKWAAGVRDGLMYCLKDPSHKWQVLVDVVSANQIEPEQ